MSCSSSINEQKYTLEMRENERTVRESKYFSKWRSCYELLRNDYELPRISRLTILTSKVSNIEDSSFVRSIFQTLNDGQKIVCCLSMKFM